MTGNRDPDFTPFRGNADAIKVSVAERPSVSEPHATHRHDRAVLAHADNRVVATVRHVEVGPYLERGVAGPVGITRLDFGWSQIDRLVQVRGGSDVLPRP
jgi:hypothetical protein